MRKVVVNTTPLIALSHAGQINILKKLYGEIIIPEAVYRELSVKTESVCKKAVDSSLDWIRIKAKQEGYIDELKTILRQMVENGIYISQSLFELCLKQVGEV